jgi:hypothetical protein
MHIKPEYFIKLASGFGLLIVVLSVFQLDGSFHIFTSKAELHAYERLEIYKSTMLGLGTLIFLMWPLLSMNRFLLKERGVEQKKQLWKRIAFALCTFLVGLGGATGWIFLNR